MSKYRVTRKNIILSFCDIEADDEEDAIEKAKWDDGWYDDDEYIDTIEEYAKVIDEEGESKL